MKEITQANLAASRPSYRNYNERLDTYIQNIGLESENPAKPYGSAVRQWNKESAIGFTEQEIQILELIYQVDERNQRFDNDTHIQPGHGGNTAEHPIFMGLAFDRFKDKAGLGAEYFDPQSPDALQLAKLSQRVHGLIAVHDVGEIVDISFGEQLKAGASYKEPEEEGLVGPFKFKLAAYALSEGKPEFYAEVIRGIKDDALAAKRDLFQQAVDGKITGDEFVAGVGKVIGARVAEVETQMQGKSVAPAYAKAGQSLSDLFDEAEHGHSIESHLLHLADKFEGSFHYTAFAGKASQAFATGRDYDSPEQRMMDRLFGDGGSASYNLAKSSTIEGQISYPQKAIVPAFKAVEAEPEETRELADKLVRSASAIILRNTIGLLQKAPAFIDFSDRKKAEPGVTPSTDPQVRDEGFAARLDVQRRLYDEAREQIFTKDRKVSGLEGVIDTKAVIAVHEKAARLIESGEWKPDLTAKAVIPVGAPLPEELHVNRQEIRDAIRQYPLDVAKDYKNDQFRGEAVRLR